MSQVQLGPQTVNTNGELPKPGSSAPEFVLTGTDMNDVHLSTYAGKNIVLNIFPSVDTNICATSIREFNKRASSLENTVILCISKDLPFAQKRFCGAEGLDRVISLSDFRGDFGKKYGVELVDGSFAGLLSRAVIVIDTKGNIKYTELVSQIGHEPNYEAAIQAL